jgi:hypothetical protein
MFVRLSPLAVVDRWAVNAQLHARRNAMVASTRLAQRRAERVEVEEYLSSRLPASTTARPAAPHRLANG